MSGNGVCSADFHGMIVRHDKNLKRLVADVIEDEEMSLRWYIFFKSLHNFFKFFTGSRLLFHVCYLRFRKDKIILRYKMLATKQKYRADGGIAACHGFDGRKKKEYTTFRYHYS